MTLGGTRFLHGSTGGAPNVFLGLNAGNPTASGQANVGVGHSVLSALSSGPNNTAIGFEAGSQLTGGGANVLVGTLAGPSLSTGNGNVGLGVAALHQSTISSFNTAAGTNTLQNLTTGTFNVAIGHSAGSSLSGGESRNIYLVHPGFVNEFNTIRIGVPNTHTAAHIAGISGATAATGVAVLVNSDGKLGTTTSSARFKRDVHDMGSASAALHQLRPVSFRYRPELDSAGVLQYGLIAEEVDRIAPEPVVRDSLGQPYTVRYHLLVPMLLNEVQRLERERKNQQSAIAALERRVARLEAGAKP